MKKNLSIFSSLFQFLKILKLTGAKADSILIHSVTDIHGSLISKYNEIKLSACQIKVN